MRLGKVLTYKDVDEAEKLEGKKVVASENLYLIEDEAFCREYAKQYKITLAGARKGLYPFTVSYDDKFQSSSDDNKFQFIREVIDDEPRYEPYDLSDPAVRDSLRGRWIIYTKGDEYTTEEVIIVGFGKQGKDYWKVIIGTGEISATELLEYYIFDDGAPCGRLMNREDENDRTRN